MNIQSSRKIVAHRGESFIAPENTLASVQLAWDKGVKAVEVDVRLTKDKHVVLMHDKSTKRTGNCNKIIADSTLEDLRVVDVGIYKGKQWQGELIPTLAEVLKTIPDNGRLIIEIKSDAKIIIPLSEVLKNAGLASFQIEIISFDFQILAEVKQLIPQYKVLWLLDLDYCWPAWMLWVNTPKIIRKLKKYQLDGVDVWAGKKLNQNFVSQIKSCNLLLYTWTINDFKTAKKLIAMGVDAITSDRAAWMRNQLL